MKLWNFSRETRKCLCSLSSAEFHNFFFVGGGGGVRGGKPAEGYECRRWVNFALALTGLHSSAFYNKRFEALRRREVYVYINHDMLH